MAFRKVADQEDITNQYTNDLEEAVPLTTTSPKLDTEKKHQHVIDDVPAHLEPYLQTKASFGLTDDEVVERMSRFGRNELTEKKRNKILHFLSFCKACFMIVCLIYALTLYYSHWSYLLLDDIITCVNSTYWRLA